MRRAKLFDKNLSENAEPINVDIFTEDFINEIDFNNQGTAISKLFWIGVFIANQFTRCNATESRKKLHELKPHIYREIIEDNRLEKTEIAANYLRNKVEDFSKSFSPENAFAGLLNIGLRETAIKALSHGVKLANRKSNEEKPKVLSLVNSLMDSLNANIKLYNEALVWGENNRQTQKQRIMPINLLEVMDQTL